MDGAAQTTIDLAATIFRTRIDRYCSDLVPGLHLVGSAADGDFRPGQSDLDFVAVLSRIPTDADIEALGVLHRSYGSDPTLPRLDGIWLTREELRAGPDAVGPGPTSASGTFFESARGNRNPVTWISLQHGIPIIGTLDPGTLWCDRERLRAWVRQNATGYWRPWLNRSSGWGPAGLAMLGRAAPMWGVLGIARQHYTVTTGEIASKSAAGQWALERFGEHHRRILAEALASRHGAPSAYRNPFNRRRDALTFIATALAAIDAA